MGPLYTHCLKKLQRKIYVHSKECPMNTTNITFANPASTVAALAANASGPSHSPRVVAPNQITLVDEFNGRSTVSNREHIRELAQAFRNVGKLDPILLWAEVEDQKSTGRLILLDGRHRLAAYYNSRKTQEERKRGIPAIILTGTREDAMKAAAAANAAARLPWMLAERTNFAWRMVRAEWANFSRSDIAKATAISQATVSRMRRRWRLISEREIALSDHWCIDRMDRSDYRKVVPSKTPEEVERDVVTLKALLKEAEIAFVEKTGGKPSSLVMGQAIKGTMGTVRFKNMYAGVMLDEEDEFDDDPAYAPIEITTGATEDDEEMDF
jgi:ParB-like chromosome segregation protein Spo0J